MKGCNRLVGVISLFIFLISAALFARAQDEILIKPPVFGWYAYSPYLSGDLYGVNRYKSFEDFRSVFNSYEQERYSRCLQSVSIYNEQNNIESSPYVCGYVIISGKSPRANDLMNGEPYYFDVVGTIVQDSNIPNQAGSRPLDNSYAYMVFGCPESFSMLHSGSSKHCKKNIISEPHPQSCSYSFGNPISALNGSKHQREIDYVSADGLLKVARNYINQREGWNLNDLPFLYDLEEPDNNLGCGYSAFIRYHAYDSVLKKNRFFTEYVCSGYVQVPGSDYKIYIRLSNGAVIRFKSTEGGSFTSDAPHREMISKLDVDDNSASGWIYFSRDGSKMLFNSYGFLVAQEYPEGKGLIYEYKDNRLHKVSDGVGREISYFYNDNNRISQVVIPDGLTIGYQYHSSIEGALTKVIRPDDTQRVYHYEDPRFPTYLTGITDERGVRYATWTYDDQGRAISSEHAGGTDKTLLAFNADGSTTVTNPLGKQTTYHFADIAGARRVTQVEGHATPSCEGANQNYTYTPEGWIESKTDWKGNTTTYSYNTLGQEISRTEAFGTPDARTITTEWHPDFYVKTREVEGGRETLYTYNNNGRLLSSDITSAP